MITIEPRCLLRVQCQILEKSDPKILRWKNTRQTTLNDSSGFQFPSYGMIEFCFCVVFLQKSATIPSKNTTREKLVVLGVNDIMTSLALLTHAVTSWKG